MSAIALAAVYGRLGADPVERRSASGTTWATVNMAVQLDDADDAPASWIGVTAFGKLADLLCKHSKGDLLSVSGKLQLSRFQGRDGTPREQLKVIADSLVSAKTIRPGGRKRRSEGGRD